MHQVYNLPIWITEFNANKHRNEWVHRQFLQLALPFLEETESLAGYNDSSGNPALTITQVGFSFELVSNASSTETGGGLQCTVGPINDRG